MSPKLIYSDLQVTVERNHYGAIVITAEIPDRRSKETYLRSEQFYYYSIAEAVEMFAEEHNLDLWDSIADMREELGDVVDVCPDEYPRGIGRRCGRMPRRRNRGRGIS